MPDHASQRQAVLLLAHGTPQSLDQIPEYLRNVTSGRPMPQSVVEEIRHRYSLIGSSPLTELTLEQGRLLSKALHLPVYVGMRNWKPYIADVVRQMREDGITSAVSICLAPQNSRTSVGLYRRAAFAEAGTAIEMDFIDGWAEHPQLAQAFVERLQPVWQSLCARIGSVAPVLFTAHSVPCRTIQAQPADSPGRADPGPDPYPVEAKRTAANVAALLAPLGLTAADWFFAFQSQGMSGASWIGPTVEDTLTALRRQGHSAVVIQPIGFLCDHVEILYDIDIGFRDFAAAIGLEVVRPQSLNDSPRLTATLEDLARQGLARLSARASLSTPRRCLMIAIVGGGIGGLATAYQLACDGVEFTLFEAAPRLGGIIETVHRQGFVIECGPDSWVTEKPWARELAIELGLEDQIIPSNDQRRRTYVQQRSHLQTQLVPIPDGMRMMVPVKWGPLLDSPLFSWQARLAYLREPKRAEELKQSAPAHDESVADFVRRHFGEEVAGAIAGPLLAAVFGGDIAQLSVRAVMPAFVRMEAEQGSLIHALQRSASQSTQSIFTTLLSGLETLIDRMVARLPPASLRLNQPVLQMEADNGGWRLTSASGSARFDAVVLATPPDVTRRLLQNHAAGIADLLPRQATSAIVVALAFAAGQASRLRIPRGFGFVVPPMRTDVPSQEHQLLACTFVDQKFCGRVPTGAVLLRAFFGGHSGDALLSESDDQLIARARLQLSRVLGPLPHAAEIVVRRWPHSLPQYTVGHLERMAELESLLHVMPGLALVGSAYYGVGLPDLIRHGRAAARLLAGQPNTVAI